MITDIRLADEETMTIAIRSPKTDSAGRSENTFLLKEILCGKVYPETNMCIGGVHRL